MFRLNVICLSFSFVSVLLANAGPVKNRESIYLRGSVTLVPQMAIGGGSDEGESPPPFYRPRDIAVAKDGTIYVLDGKTAEITSFRATGEIIKRFSREGEGPGELRDPVGISLDKFGRVVAYEAGNRRFSLFSAQGKFLTTKPYEDQVVRFECREDGLLLLQTERELYGATSVKTKWALLAVDSALHAVAVLDSLTCKRWIAVSSGGNTISATQPFYEELVWCVGPGGEINVGRSMGYEIARLKNDFSFERNIRRNVAAAALSSEDRKKYLQDLGNLSPWARSALESQVEWPKHKPFIESLHCDGNGYLLVYRGDVRGAPTLDVFAPTGRFLAEVVIPGFRHNTTFVGEYAWMRVFTEEQLPAVVRYRLE